MLPIFSHLFPSARIIQFVTLSIAIAFCTTYAYEDECGTMKAFENYIKRKNQPLYALAKSSEKKETKCTPEVYYDSVYSIETAHIQVFYTMTGPHATTKAFAKATATSMEEAWDFYINKHKMREPKGPSVSLHFLQEVKNGLYPIEIVDLEQIRGHKIGDYFKNFGVTEPLDDFGFSQIFMENDFYYGSSKNENKDTIFVDGDTCLYAKSTIELRNIVHNFAYTDEWAKGIRLTSFHEFYHAVQLRYLDLSTPTFWFEASAAGFEEITNPDIDDYISYIPKFFERTGQPLSDSFRNYGASTLLIYLYNNVSKDIDKSIWENFSKNPNNSFEDQLIASIKPLKLDADSIFLDYSVRLSFSGKRSKDLPKKSWIHNDQSEWPSAKIIVSDSIKPNIESLAFMFYNIPQNYAPPYVVDFTNFTGKASVAIYKDGKASIYKIENNNTLNSMAPVLSSSDSSVWIFSRFGESESIPIVHNDTPPHAYPVPWKEGPLCFAPLPLGKKFIEIRTRRGDLISQEKYEGTSFCLQENQVKSMMAPGLYRFRVGNKGRTTSFIVMY